MRPAAAGAAAPVVQRGAEGRVHHRPKLQLASCRCTEVRATNQLAGTLCWQSLPASSLCPSGPTKHASCGVALSNTCENGTHAVHAVLHLIRVTIEPTLCTPCRPSKMPNPSPAATKSCASIAHPPERCQSSGSGSASPGPTRPSSVRSFTSTPSAGFCTGPAGAAAAASAADVRPGRAPEAPREGAGRGQRYRTQRRARTVSFRDGLLAPAGGREEEQVHWSILKGQVFTGGRWRMSTDETALLLPQEDMN